MNREQFEKILAVAINPGAYEKEAVAALLKAREIVRENPSLAHRAPEPPPPPPPAVPPPAHSIQYRATHVAPEWSLIFLGSLSAEAYGLGLRSKFSCDFKETPTAFDIRCDGPKAACDLFATHLNWIIGYINDQQAKSSPS